METDEVSAKEGVQDVGKDSLLLHGAAIERILKAFHDQANKATVFFMSVEELQLKVDRLTKRVSDLEILFLELSSKVDELPLRRRNPPKEK